jgi:Lrp/AsnC family leucine-responsive transcriptional regulator
MSASVRPRYPNDAYRAVLQRERVGLGFSVFIGVRIEGHANGKALVFEKAILAMPEVVAFHLVSGQADYARVGPRSQPRRRG